MGGKMAQFGLFQFDYADLLQKDGINFFKKNKSFHVRHHYVT